MRFPYLLILVSLLMSLSACSQAVPPSANNPVSTTLVSPTAAPAATPSPTATPPGGGEYWIASTYRDTDGRFNAFITRPLVDAAPEIIFRTEAGYYLSSLVWSPDGQYLVFTDGNGDLTRAFYVYDRLSRQLQTFDLNQMTGKPGMVSYVAWSPDVQSRQLAFNLGDSPMEGSPWLANILQGEASPINFPNSTWLWEPGGQSLIFLAWDAITRFDLSSMTGEELILPTQIVELGGTGRLQVAGFFPNLDGFLTSVTTMDGTRSYTLISEDGSQETVLFQTGQGWIGGLDSQPLLSPDGNQIGLNFSGQGDNTGFVTSRLDQLPLVIPAVPELNSGVILLWSPDSSVYVTRIADSESGPFSLGFYDAQTGSLLRTYQPSSPFLLQMSRHSIFGMMIPTKWYEYFASVWIP